MTTPTLNSAYPANVDELLPRARKIAERDGRTPSARALMRELRIGKPKADAVLDALRTDPTLRPDAPAETRPAPRPRTRPEPVADAPQTRPEAHPEPLPEAQPDAAQPRLTDALSTAAATLVTRLVERRDQPTSEQPIPLPETPGKPIRTWPVLLLAAPAFVAVWSGWVGLGELTGFGVVHPLPGIADGIKLNTAITLPIGVETYAAYALHVWLTPHLPRRARRFAGVSALGSLLFGAAGQIAYHVMAANGITRAPWQVTTFVSALPVLVLAMGAALARLVRNR